MERHARRKCRLREAVVDAPRVPGLIRVDEGLAAGLSREVFCQEVASIFDGPVPVLLIKNRVVGIRVHDEALVCRGESLEKSSLRCLLHDPVTPRHQHEGGHTDCPGILDEAGGCVVHIEEDIGGDGMGDQVVVVDQRLLLGIMCQDLGLHVARHGGHQVQPEPKPQRRNGQRNIQLDAESRRGQHQGLDGRCVVVYPGCSHHGADTVGHHRHILQRDVVGRRKMPGKDVGIPGIDAEVFGPVPPAGRAAIAAGVPGEAGGLFQPELLHNLHESPGMLVSAMEEDHGALRLTLGQPRPVENLVPIPGLHRVLGNVHDLPSVVTVA